MEPCTIVLRILFFFFPSTHETFSKIDLYNVRCQLYLNEAGEEIGHTPDHKVNLNKF